jgi:hypothetical protein
LLPSSSPVSPSTTRFSTSAASAQRSASKSRLACAASSVIWPAVTGPLLCLFLEGSTSLTSFLSALGSAFLAKNLNQNQRIIGGGVES